MTETVPLKDQAAKWLPSLSREERDLLRADAKRVEASPESQALLRSAPFLQQGAGWSESGEPVGLMVPAFLREALDEFDEDMA